MLLANFQKLSHCMPDQITSCSKTNLQVKVKVNSCSCCELKHKYVPCILFYSIVTGFFFQLLTSFFSICSHIFKTLNTISTTSDCCDHTFNTFNILFTQYSENIPCLQFFQLFTRNFENSSFCQNIITIIQTPQSISKIPRLFAK